jgi:hypothetical protein
MVHQGSVGFRDTSIKPIFKTGLYALDFEMNRLASTGDKPATYRRTSMADKYAPFTVQGTLAPLQRQPEMAFTSQPRGLELPTLLPYTGAYIGYNLKSGQLALDLQYELKQHKLRGKNNFIAKQLYLGDKVPSEQGVNLPVVLGLALLRDVNGVIDLDFGVTGDMNDPVFSVSGLIWKALVNIIVKAAASPFQLLASLVGSSEDLG